MNRDITDDFLPRVPDPSELPEAPASATVKFWIDGYGVMLTMRDVEVKNILAKLAIVIQKAKDNGWKNTWDTEPAVKPKAEEKRGAPCPKCGAQTVNKSGISKKTGKPYNFYSCVNYPECDGKV